MIATILLSIVNFFWYGLIDLVWIKELPFLTLSVFTSAINFFTQSLLPYFSFINGFFPLDTFVGLGLAILTMHIFIFGFKAVRMIINLFRPTASV